MAKKDVKAEVLKAINEDLIMKKILTIGLDAKVPYYVNSGHYVLNWVISGNYLGGWPGGRVSEVYGDPSTGKSILMCYALRAMQRGEITVSAAGKRLVDTAVQFAILDDTEHAYLAEFCEFLGVDIDDVISIGGKKTIEEHFGNMEEVVNLIRSKTKKSPIGVLLDSISQLSTKHELEKGLQKVDMTKAKQAHAAMRIYSDFIAKNMIMYLLASHVTQNVGVMYGPQKVVKGGSAVAFESSVRMDLKYKKRFLKKVIKTEEAGERAEAYGVKVLMENTKNKVCAPFRFAVVDIYFNKGIDPYSGAFDHFFRQDKLNRTQTKTDKRPEIWEWVDPVSLLDGKTFEREKMAEFIIENDLFGVKKAGRKYADILHLDEDILSTVVTDENNASQDMVILPPPIVRESKGDE